jgi:hypothetical protein
MAVAVATTFRVAGRVVVVTGPVVTGPVAVVVGDVVDVLDVEAGAAAIWPDSARARRAEPSRYEPTPKHAVPAQESPASWFSAFWELS